MKIICVSNLGQDYISDRLITENVNYVDGRKKVKELNSAEGAQSADYYRLVENNYDLFIFKP